MEDRKSIAKGIMAQMAGKKPEMSVEVEVEPKSDEMGLDSAAEEILSAVEAKDASALKEAMKSFMEMCSSESEAE